MATSKWVLEPSHSELHFKIRHLMISNVSGSFTKFDGTVETEGEDLTTANIHFSIDADTISTNNEQRDGHLKSADFFDVATYPKITFEATGMNKKSDEAYEVSGNLTMHGVTKSVSLNVEFGGIAKDMYGNTKAGFEIDAKLNRKDFGLSWNAPTEAGGVIVSEEVKIHANLQFVKA